MKSSLPRICISGRALLTVLVFIMVPFAADVGRQVEEKRLRQDSRYCWESRSILCPVVVRYSNPGETPYEDDPQLKEIYLKAYRKGWISEMRRMTPEVLHWRATGHPYSLSVSGGIVCTFGASPEWRAGWRGRQAGHSDFVSLFLDLTHHAGHAHRLLREYSEFREQMLRLETASR